MADETMRNASHSQDGSVDKSHWLRRVTGETLYSHETQQKRTSTSLSVIVPAYNEQYLVETSLARLKILAESPLLHSVQVIVVNDGSKDATADALARFRRSLEPGG